MFKLPNSIFSFYLLMICFPPKRVKRKLHGYSTSEVYKFCCLFTIHKLRCNYNRQENLEIERKI